MVDPPDNAAAIRVIAMPADTNPLGDIFGGWLMCQMDLAASSVAARRSEGRAATVAADSMSFLRPVKVGDEVSVYATLISTGRHGPAAEKVTEAAFTFVAVDNDGLPRPLPEIDGASGAAMRGNFHG